MKRTYAEEMIGQYSLEPHLKYLQISKAMRKLGKLHFLTFSYDDLLNICQSVAKSSLCMKYLLCNMLIV
jgi:hypothetical protein